MAIYSPKENDRKQKKAHRWKINWKQARWCLWLKKKPKKEKEKKSSTSNRDNQEEWEYVCKKRKREWLEEKEMGWYWTLMRNWTVEISSHLLYHKGWRGHMVTAEQVVGSPKTWEVTNCRHYLTELALYWILYSFLTVIRIELDTDLGALWGLLVFGAQIGITDWGWCDLP